ncbi:MAG TPA: hypothetical protein VGR00_08040 [Thermoanaerobaculia bacterium]|nr:hypothetical protein [Thermoanaerobaculia bacterium]
MRAFSRSKVWRLFTALLFFAFPSSRAFADAHTWSGASGTGNWSDAGNWSVGGAPTAAEAQPVDLTFPTGIASKAMHNDVAGLTVHSLFIVEAGYTLDGSSFTLSADIGLGGGVTTGNVAISTSITLTANSHLINVLASCSLTMNGAFTGPNSGVVINKQGPGQLDLPVANNFVHQTIITAGVVTLGDSLSLGPGVTSNTSVLNGASLQILGSTGLAIPVTFSLRGSGIGGTGALIVSSSTSSFTGGGLFTTANATVNVGGGAVLSFTNSMTMIGAGLVKIGTGTLAFNNVLSSATMSPTNVNEGTLFANSTFASPTTVNAGATFGGTGNFNSESVLVNSGGILAPGQSPGILGTGNLNLTPGSTFSVEINGPTVSTQYDQLNVTGTVTLGGTLAVSLGYTPSAGTQFTVINNDGADAVTGTFAGIPEKGGLVVSGQELLVSYLGTDFSTGNDVVLTAVNMPSVTIAPPGSTMICSPPLTLSAVPAEGTTVYTSYQWYLDSVMIPSANASTYGATMSGTYTVTVTDSANVTSSESPGVVLTADTDSPMVTPPTDATVTQTVCQ